MQADEKNIKVLLVDDETEILSFMEMFMKRLSITSTTANSGKLAIKTDNEKKFDMVFLDIQLKDMSGFEVLKAIKKINPQVRVIMITGRAEKDFEMRARELGVLDYITKPLDLADLKSKVNKYLLS